MDTRQESSKETQRICRTRSAKPMVREHVVYQSADFLGVSAFDLSSHKNSYPPADNRQNDDDKENLHTAYSYSGKLEKSRQSWCFDLIDGLLAKKATYSCEH